MILLLLVLTSCAYRPLEAPKVEEIERVEEKAEQLEVKEEPIEVKEIPPEPRKYRVWIWQENRDCLWNISKKVYGNPYMWKKIYEANRDIIKNPDLIFPKQILIIP